MMERSRATRRAFMPVVAAIVMLSVAVPAWSGRTAAPRGRKIAADTARVAVRAVPWKKIEGFRNSADFRYDRADPVNLSIWDRIKQWIFYQLSRIFDKVDGTAVSNYLGMVIYPVVAVTIIYVLLKVFGAGMQGLFFSPRRKAGAPAVPVDDLDSMDIGALIEERLKIGDYRAVVRLQYLRCLKRLAGKNLISLKRNKTNDEYVRELGDSPLAAGFGELSRIFEYVWYGNFPVSEESYSQVRDLLGGFYAGLGEDS